MSNHKIGVAIIGSGNIGSDLMMKILSHGRHLKLLALAGIDSTSDGLARARRLGVAVTHEGIDGLVNLPEFKDIKIVFDATSAGAHIKHNAVLQQYGVRVIDLTPAAVGPYVVPVCNLDEHIQAANINMVTCGGQATIPIVHAINQISKVQYAEIVASIASNSAGPGTRANINEFIETTAQALQSIGGASRAKAIMILNPAEPPVIMRDTVYCLLAEQGREEAVLKAVAERVAQVQQYVPGYRLKQAVQFENISVEEAGFYPDLQGRAGTKVTVFLEVEGGGHYLPAYAGNLDIMTSAALASAEIVAGQLASQGA